MSGLGSVDGSQRPQDIHLGSEASNKAKHAEQLRQISSGNMDGDNLIIQDYNEDGVADGDIIGSRPTLSPPRLESTLANYQTAMTQMEGVDSASSQKAMMSILGKHIKSEGERNISGHSEPLITEITQKDSSLTGLIGSEGSFNADFNKGQMTVMLGNDTAQFNMVDGKAVATINGQPANLNQSELGALSDFFVLMELFHEMGVSQRKFSREARNTTNAGIVSNIKQQADEQRKAAANQLVAGIASGAVKLASAGLSMAGSVKGMKADAATFKANPNAGAQMYQGGMISQKFSSIGQGFEASGEMGASGARYQASQHEARQTELRAGEKQLDHLKQTEQDQMQVAQDLLNKARETFAQVWAQVIQTQQNLARNI